VNKLLSIGMLLLCMVSCIEPFRPEVEEAQDMLVINGRLTDQPGMQFVEVSRASPFYEPDRIPVKGCVVRIEDGRGQGFYYRESLPGVYRAHLDAPFLGVNKAYKLLVRTPDGQDYQSEYDSLLACPPIDTLYYHIESRENQDYPGLRFSVDIKRESGDSWNFLWKLEETFEYHARYPIEYFWDGRKVREIVPRLPIDTLKICFKTNSLSELYLLSYRNIDARDIVRHPLNYVSAGTPKLLRKYGLVVSQYSLSDDAFHYWDKMRTMISETGGLYEKQPASSGGNIYNINDPEEQILGFFYASQERKRWIIIKNNFDFPMRDYFCPVVDTVGLEENNYAPKPGEYVYPLEFDDAGNVVTSGFISQACFDCTLRGGSLEPPDYWLNNE